MADEVVKPDWDRWCATAKLWVPLLLIVSLTKVSNFPDPQASPHPDMHELLQRAYFFVKLQATVNAIPFLLLGVHAALLVRNILTMQVYPPPGANVLFPTRRRRGSSTRPYALVHLLLALAFLLRAATGLRPLFWPLSL